MRVPASELSESTGGTNAAPLAGRKPGEPEKFATISSEGYEMQAESARFWGGVHVTDPDLDWTCDRATVQLPPPGSSTRGMVAEQEVEFVMLDQNGQEMHGTGDRSIYSYSVPAAGKTNETLTLIGDPAMLEKTNGIFENSVIVFDRARNKLTARGSYVIHGETGKLGTNSFSGVK